MVDVDTVNMDGDRGEQRRAIAFAAGDIEDCLTGHEGPGERISVPVLVRDLARALGQESFAGERCFVSASGGDLRIAGHEERNADWSARGKDKLCHALSACTARSAARARPVRKVKRAPAGSRR